MTVHDISVAGAPVFINRTDLRLADVLAEIPEAGTCHVLCDENTVNHCLPLLECERFAQPPVIFRAGEKHKTLDTCSYVWESLLKQGADRKSILVCVGGGVVTDLGGFCASTYMRGIRFVHVPTTLLAMCDAALGGKQGVDFAGLKNYIGVIRQPECVWIDDHFLETLPTRQIANGMAEVVKHALIGDPDLFELLRNSDSPDSEILLRAITVKKKFVDGDVQEQGKRAALNFGHTFGHAIESHFLDTDSPLLHGEAIALGMVMELWLSHVQFGSPSPEFCIAAAEVILKCTPVTATSISLTELMAIAAHDKKKSLGSVRFSLIQELGDPAIEQHVSEEKVDQLVSNPVIAGQIPWLVR